MITGQAVNVSEFSPFNEGDLFVLTLEADTSVVGGYPSTAGSSVYHSSAALTLTLDIAGLQGVFGAFMLEISNDTFYASDTLTLVTPLDVPENIFNGFSEANIGVSFEGPVSMLQDDSLVQDFLFTGFSSKSIHFDVTSAGFYAELQVTGGSYAAVVPLPPAVLLLVSGLIAILGFGASKHTGPFAYGQGRQL